MYNRVSIHEDKQIDKNSMSLHRSIIYVKSIQLNWHHPFNTNLIKLQQSFHYFLPLTTKQIPITIATNDVLHNTFLSLNWYWWSFILNLKWSIFSLEFSTFDLEFFSFNLITTSFSTCSFFLYWFQVLILFKQYLIWHNQSEHHWSHLVTKEVIDPLKMITSIKWVKPSIPSEPPEWVLDCCGCEDHVSFPAPTKPLAVRETRATPTRLNWAYTNQTWHIYCSSCLNCNAHSNSSLNFEIHSKLIEICSILGLAFKS